jgi:hypothetical protein
MSVLATFSGSLHHGHALRMLRNGSWWSSPRLWVLLVGPPSCKKTPIFNAATDPLLKYECRLREKFEQELHLFEKAQAAGDESAGGPERPPRYVIWDTTVEALGEILARIDDKGILVKSDELAGWLSSMERYSNSAGRSDRAFWLQAYDGGPHAVDRIKRGELFIRNLSVSIIGGIQPERLAEVRAGLSTDGLLQRFLPVMLCSPSFPLDRQGLDENYGALVRQLIFAKPARLIMTDPALAAMAELRKHVFDLEQASSGLAAGFDSFVGKLAGICGNLALILHMAHDPQKGATYEVDEPTVLDVRKLVLDFILPHALEFYRGTTATSGERLRKLASWILTSGKTRILASDLATAIRDLRGLTLPEVNERVSPLVAAGWLVPTDNTPVCRSWRVAPAVHTQLADCAKAEAERRAKVASLMGPDGRKGNVRKNKEEICGYNPIRRREGHHQRNRRYRKVGAPRAPMPETAPEPHGSPFGNVRKNNLRGKFVQCSHKLSGKNLPNLVRARGSDFDPSSTLRAAGRLRNPHKTWIWAVRGPKV